MVLTIWVGFLLCLSVNNSGRKRGTSLEYSCPHDLTSSEFSLENLKRELLGLRSHFINFNWLRQQKSFREGRYQFREVG